MRTTLHRVFGVAVPVRPPALRQACAHALPEIVDHAACLRAAANPENPMQGDRACGHAKLTSVLHQVFGVADAAHTPRGRAASL